MNDAAHSRRRGGPFAVLATLLVVWIAGRAAFWEDPFPTKPWGFAEAEVKLPEATRQPDFIKIVSADVEPAIRQTRYSLPLQAAVVPGLSVPAALMPGNSQSNWRSKMSPTIAAGHQLLLAAAFSVDWVTQERDPVALRPVALRSGALRSGAVGVSVNPAFPSVPSSQYNMDRWSLDAFAFFRQGSTRQDPSQGRVPIYGASQAGAYAQFRIAPNSSHDPRAYLRGYRALVSGGETEVAAGLSARPIGSVPVRLAAEVRVTESDFRTEIRPAGSLTTEIPPVRLPSRFNLEAFAGIGYVGGDADTYFADGQATVTREVVSVDGIGNEPARLSLGAGTWGGAQEDGKRLDVGPTLRIDLLVGEVPARISVDWREQVAGDAAPNSGVAATLSTRF